MGHVGREPGAYLRPYPVAPYIDEPVTDGMAQSTHRRISRLTTQSTFDGIHRGVCDKGEPRRPVSAACGGEVRAGACGHGIPAPRVPA